MKKTLFKPILLPFAFLLAISASGSSQLDSHTQTPLAFSDVAQIATAAVVSINVVKRGENNQNDPRSIGIGSGVIIKKDGFILTNNHVIENAEKITVKFDEKHKISARIVGVDPKTDLAVIKIESPENNYPTLSFGDSSRVKVGDWAIAIGNPFGLNRSMSKGIISAVGRAQMGILDIEDFIQTDAAINPGSSGGPLLNLNGEMIGINTAIFSQGMGFVGIGFAIPAEIAQEVAAKLIHFGEVRRGWTGISVQEIDEDLAQYFHSPGTSGVLISNIAPQSPAEQASLHVGDIILSYNQKPVRNAFDFKTASSKSTIGSTVSIEISRNGLPHHLQIKIREQPKKFNTIPLGLNQKAGKLSSRPKSLGLVIEDIPEEIVQVFNLNKNSGVLIAAVEPGSPASEAGLLTGDIILQADRVTVHTAKEFVNLAKRFIRQDLSMLYVQRGPDERLFVPLRMRSSE